MEKHDHNTHFKSNPILMVIIGSMIIGAFILAGAFIMRGGSGNSAEFVDPDKIFMGREFKNEEFTQGSTKNKVLFVQYSDTECPFCKKFHEETIAKIETDPKYSSIAMAYRHFPLPFHLKAPKEAEATLCAREQGGQKGYRDYLDTIFTDTPANDGLDPAELPKIATKIGLDAAKLTECLNSGKYTQQVQDDLADGSTVGVTGTPNSLVMIKTDTGYRILARIDGARDVKYVQAILDQAIKFAK